MPEIAKSTQTAENKAQRIKRDTTENSSRSNSTHLPLLVRQTAYGWAAVREPQGYYCVSVPRVPRQRLNRINASCAKQNVRRVRHLTR